jgi:hypothetical protein
MGRLRCARDGTVGSMRRLVVVLAVVVLAGCGGSGDPSHEEFAADVNRICREGEARVAAIAEDVQGRQPGEVADAIERAGDEFDPVLRRLRGLEAPEDLRADWNAFLDDIGAATDLLGQVAEAVRTGNREEGARLAERYEQIARQTRPFAEQYNLDGCLSG